MYTVLHHTGNLYTPHALSLMGTKAFSEPCQTSEMELFAIVIAVNCFLKKFHLRCLRWFWIRLWGYWETLSLKLEYLGAWRFSPLRCVKLNVHFISENLHNQKMTKMILTGLFKIE